MAQGRDRETRRVHLRRPPPDACGRERWGGPVRGTGEPPDRATSVFNDSARPVGGGGVGVLTIRLTPGGVLEVIGAAVVLAFIIGVVGLVIWFRD